MKAYLEPEEVEEMENQAECLRDRLLLRLLFRTGCRISEALGLEMKDIDLDQGTVTIQHLKVRSKLSCPGCKTRLARTSRFCPGCGSRVEEAVSDLREHRRRRVLPVDQDTLGILEEYMERGGPISKKGAQLLFGINRHRAWRIVTDCACRAGIFELSNPETGRKRGVSPHRLRDAFAVHAVKHDDSGDGLRLLQEQLGHADIGTTMRYRKVASQELKEWYERLWRHSNDRDPLSPERDSHIPADARQNNG